MTEWKPVCTNTKDFGQRPQRVICSIVHSYVFKLHFLLIVEPERAQVHLNVPFLGDLLKTIVFSSL